MEQALPDMANNQKYLIDEIKLDVGILEHDMSLSQTHAARIDQWIRPARD